MKLLAAVFAFSLAAQPTLPIKLVSEWAKLPKGMYIGECSGVSVDKDDNVWVFHRGKSPIMKFDKTGKLLDHWDGAPITSSHGIKIDPEGNVWTVDVAAPQHQEVLARRQAADAHRQPRWLARQQRKQGLLQSPHRHRLRAQRRLSGFRTATSTRAP